jgi:hypothetical protein
MVGEKGRITHWDGSTFEEHDSKTTAKLWGVIAFAPDDVWSVGGTPGQGDGPDDVVLHYDGAAWAPVTLPAGHEGRALFKIWGPSTDELFVVGEAGAIWHLHDGAWAFESDPPIASGNLLTVSGCSAKDVYAVGGRDMLHYDGSAWTKLDRAFGNDVNGVFCAESGALVTVAGMGGLKQRTESGTVIDDFKEVPHGDLHSTWVDETGSVWVGGGSFVALPKAGEPRNGIVGRYGIGHVSDAFE